MKSRLAILLTIFFFGKIKRDSEIMGEIKVYAFVRSFVCSLALHFISQSHRNVIMFDIISLPSISLCASVCFCVFTGATSYDVHTYTDSDSDTIHVLFIQYF